MLQIGHLVFRDKPLFLAPMEDVTDPSFRRLCRNYGADMVYTEFVSSDALVRDVVRAQKKLIIHDDEKPAAIQIYGHVVEAMAESAKMSSSTNADILDINCGCPVKKIAARGAGAGLLNNIPLMLAITDAVVKSSTLPVTVKTRLGWDDEHKDIVQIAEQLQDKGIRAITIHGRTRAQLYRGAADWSLIGEVKHNPRMKIPVIGNGDIVSPEGAAIAFEKFGVDAIMIGRGAIGRPWIFRQIRHYLDTGELLADPPLSEKVQLAKEHFALSLESKGVPRGVFEMRRHFINYFKGLPFFKDFRLRLVTSLDVEEIFRLLNEINNRYADSD